MGFYSVNRVAYLAENNDYLNKSLLESIYTIDESAPTSLLELSAYITEHENKMFNTLIELDFRTVHEQNAEASSEEKKEDDKKEESSDTAKEAEKKDDDKAAKDDAVKKNIFQKIKDFIIKVLKAIKNVFVSLVDKLMVLITNDKKAIEKYGPALRKLTDADLAKYDKEFEHFSETKSDEFFAKYREAMYESTEKPMEEEEVTPEKIREYINNMGKDLKKLAEESFSKSKLSKDDVETALDFLDRNKDANPVKELKNNIKELDKEIKRTLKANKKSASPEEYKLFQESVKFIKDITGAVVTFVKKQYSCSRKIVIIAGRWALANASSNKAEDKKTDEVKDEKKDEQTVDNEAYDFALAEASDVYVSECLEF